MTTNPIYVTKRNGNKELIDLDKIHKVITWAAEGLKDVSVSQVELKAQLQFFDGIKTSDIHDVIVKAAADLISPEAPDYQYLAARLLSFGIRKKAYGVYQPPSLYEQVLYCVREGKYDAHILEDYTKEELDILNAEIDHNRDLNVAYAGMNQLAEKYLVRDRGEEIANPRVYESPQFIFMLVGVCLFSSYQKDKRLDYVKRFYHATSTFKLSLPTPVMGGVRTPLRQFSSCVLIEAGDSLDQINAANAAIVKYVAQRAGIGFNFGMIRALGSTIRNGSANHTGVIPFLQMFQKAVKCCSQGGLRGGSATGFYPIWHLDVESLLVLKNNRGVEENRVRHIDYGVQISNLFYRRLIRNENITLFSPNAVPGMYDAFFADQGRFEKLYLAAEADPTIRKKSIPAMTLFSLFAQETMSTARIYIQNVDHCNTHSPFKPEIAPVRQSNLCLEIALPTKPLDHVYDADGEVALCTLSAFNMGNVTIDELPELADLIVRALDALLDYQDYPLPAAKRSTMYRRTLGVGVINYANWIAKNGFRYSDGSAKNATFEWFEAMQYSLMRASMVLAKEQGPCPGFHETRMSDGIMPFDTANQNAKDLVSVSLKQDWDSLRKDIMQYGMRNSTLSALMPSESSSQVSNATNGIEPPRGLLSIKGSKDGQLRQIVPDIRELGDKYELLWDIPDNNGYIELVAIMQIFICQAISANLNYDPSKYANENVPLKVILGHMLKMAKLGCKTRYYCNTRDNVQKVKTAEPVVVESDCPDGACKI